MLYPSLVHPAWLVSSLPSMSNRPPSQSFYLCWVAYRSSLPSFTMEVGAHDRPQWGCLLGCKIHQLQRRILLTTTTLT